MCSLPNKSKCLRWVGKRQVWLTREMYTEFWWIKLRERDHLEHLDPDGHMLLKMI